MRKVSFKKQLLSFALVLAMVFSMVPVHAFAADGDSYSRVTDIADVLNGGEFILVAKNGDSYVALSTTIKGKPDAVAVTVTDNTVTATDLPVWTIAAIEGGGISLFNGESYLKYSSSTNLGSDTAAYDWTVTAQDGGTFRFVASTATTRGIVYRASTYNCFGAYAVSNAGSSEYVVDLLVFKKGATGTNPEPSETTEPPVTTEPSAPAEDPDAISWTKKDLADIASTDTVAITMTKGEETWALFNGNGASKAPTAVVVTVNGNTMTSKSVDDISWNITNTNGNLVIYTAGSTETWLYSTATNNGVRVGTNKDNIWVVDASTGYLKHVATSRYLGVYTTTPDWRAYTNTTGNTAGQTLAFWVLDSGESEPTDCTHPADSVTYTDNGADHTWTCADCGTTGTEDHSYDATTEKCVCGASNACDHVEETVPGYAATCTEPGLTDGVKCSLCGETLTAQETIPATGEHTYVDGKCTVCGTEDPTAVDYSGRYYIAAIRGSGNYQYMTNDLGIASTKRYQAADSGLTALPAEITTPAESFIFILTKNADGTYTVTDYNGQYLSWSSGNSGALSDTAFSFTVTAVDGGLYNISFAVSETETRYLSLNSNAGNGYFAFYKSGQINGLALIPVTGNVCTHPAASVTYEDNGVDHTWICADCGATGTEDHSYDETTEKCVCGAEDPTAVDYSGRYYIAAIRGSGNYWYMTNDLGAASTKRFQALDSKLSVLPAEITYPVAECVFTLTKNADGTYTITDSNGQYLSWSTGNSGELSDTAFSFAVTAVEGGLYTITFAVSDSETRYLSLNSSTSNNYFAFYTGTQINELALIPVNGELHTHSYSVTGTVDATCTTGGSVTYTCVCGDSYKEVSEATGHFPVFPNNGDGTHYEECCICLERLGENVPHTYDETTHVCVCGAVETFTVTWYDENNNVVATEEVEYGKNAQNVPAVPEKEGYTGKWSNDATNVTSDLSITPVYTVKEYTVTYDGNGNDFYFWETGWQENITVKSAHGETSTVIYWETEEYGLELPEYVFAGWNTKADGTGTTYQPGDEITVTGDLTLYAQYDEIAVGSATLSSGEYVDLNGNVTTTKPEGGYAYYENGKLVLNNYSFDGEGYLWRNESWKATSAVYYLFDNLTIELVGINTLKDTTYDDSSAVCASNLVITGTGSLTATTTCEGILAYNLTISGCTVTASGYWGIFSYDALTIQNATVHVLTGGIYAGKGITLEGVMVKTPANGAISEDGTQIVDSDGEYAEEVLIGIPGLFDVTFTGTHVTSNGAATVQEGNAYTATLTADPYYDLPATVTVKVNGKEISGYTYENGVLTIPAQLITGNVEIIAVAQIQKFALTFTYMNADGEWVTLTQQVAYGTELKDLIPETPSYVTEDGKHEFRGWAEENGKDLPDTMPAFALSFRAEYSYTGWYTDANGNRLYSDNGSNVTGWNRIDDNNEIVSDNSGAMYYFDANGYAVKDITEIDGELYAFDHETYQWLEDLTGIYEAENGDLYYVENGIAVKNKGLVRVINADGHVNYYYFGCDSTANTCPSGHECDPYLAQKSCTHWVENNNGLLVKWDYTFGEDGVIVYDPVYAQSEQENHQIVTYDGVKYYTIDGIKVHYGLFQQDGKYYYARSSGALVTGETYWITDVNGLLAEGSYTFDTNGAMVKEGIYQGYYYENYLRTYAGLIEIDGSYYYVRTSGALAIGRYWITKTNGLFDMGSYNFGEDGKMILTQGIVDGYYYVNGVKTYAGLIEIDGSYYYVKTDGEVVRGRSYWITKTNGLMKEGSYTFDDSGKMTDPAELLPEVNENTNGIVDGYYYENGKLTYAGLIEIDGKFYYVRTSGQLATGYYWITKTNGLMEEGAYTFDETGAMVTE